MKHKKGHRLHIHINNELKEIFIGHHTIFSVLGFTLGGILLGETVKEILVSWIGTWATLAIGLVLMLGSGIVLHKFNETLSPSIKKQLDLE